MDVYEIVKKLVGDIRPVGETHVDDARFENLKVVIGLVDKLIYDIDSVAMNKNRPEFSLNRAGRCASEFLTNLGKGESK